MDSNNRKTKLKKSSINTLKFISEDIHHIKNPIKYHNKYFNKNWNKYNNQLQQIFNNVSTSLVNIIQEITFEQINDHKLSTKHWINKPHNEPINYEYYIDNNKSEKNNLNITFNEFCVGYYRRDIKIKNIDYKTYIFKYSNLDQNNDYIIIDRLNYMQNGYFISLDIKSYIENTIDSYEMYRFPHLNMEFFYSSNIDQNRKMKIIMKFYVISKWIYTLFGNTNNPTEIINFIYFDTPLTKKINKSYDFLSSQNVNSGSSVSGKMLMIWRSEESSKVFIHELIHYLDKDVKYDYDFNNIIKIKMGNINYPILINETITELQAQLFHTIYMSNVLNKDNIVSNQDISIFKTLYNYEQIFSWYQFAKIMDFFSIKKFKEKYLIEKFNQSSNVFSYYILKSILGLNFGDILFELDHIKKLLNNKITQTNTLDNLNSFEFVNTITPWKDTSNQSQHNHEILEFCNVNSCQKLVKYIKKHINKPPVKLINKIIKYLDSIDDSLRMTVFEFDI